jgi:hypothetical protein
MEFSKLFIGAGAGLLGAILGGSIAGWRASTAVAAAGRTADEFDPFAQANPHLIGSSVASVINGALIGGLIAIVLAIALMIYFSGERIPIEKEMEDTE